MKRETASTGNRVNSVAAPGNAICTPGGDLTPPRLACMLMVAAAGIMAFSSFERVPPTRFMIEHCLTGGMDAVPSWTAFLVEWKGCLQAAAAVFSVTALRAVREVSRQSLMFCLTVLCTLVLLLIPHLVQFTLDLILVAAAAAVDFK